MTDTAFTVKVDNRTFTLDRITLGDWRMFKTEFGLNASDIVTELTNDAGEAVQILNLDDPNVLIALIVASLHHERPNAPVSALVAEVEALGMDGLEFPDLHPEDEAVAEDPTKGGVSEETAEPAQSQHGDQGKRPKKPGTRR